MRVDLFHDRVYLLSPRGEIVDVPVGGTPLDFAYTAAFGLAHRTRDARVNGRILPLDSCRMARPWKSSPGRIRTPRVTGSRRLHALRKCRT